MKLDPGERARALRDEAAALNARYGGLDARGLIAAMVEGVFPGRIAMVSSFGAESAVLLDLVAQVDPAVPVIFLDTGKLFGETLRYKEALGERLGLMDVRSIRPDPREVAARDPDGILWTRDPDACCALRKAEPLARALAPFDAWFTGRKRFQSSSRAAIEAVETDGVHIKVNPLAHWSEADLHAHLAARKLPKHPLIEDGYLSIGCMPCTDRVAPGGDSRDGRWAGLEKTECGIHSPLRNESGGSGI
ncbi:phosphoadenylyl-sulfate reductase [Zavarzinia sp. CC-PAN008]|uniref:phosphoadenylyl-sulfate reductase n=1 Tax=Zavarzinia sp. CC-PAN008 TaxID=3243332 RepID=UPI003F744EFD